MPHYLEAPKTQESKRRGNMTRTSIASSCVVIENRVAAEGELGEPRVNGTYKF